MVVWAGTIVRVNRSGQRGSPRIKAVRAQLCGNVAKLPREVLNQEIGKKHSKIRFLNQIFRKLKQKQATKNLSPLLLRKVVNKQGRLLTSMDD